MISITDGGKRGRNGGSNPYIDVILAREVGGGYGKVRTRTIELTGDQQALGSLPDPDRSIARSRLRGTQSVSRRQVAPFIHAAIEAVTSGRAVGNQGLGAEGGEESYQQVQSE